MYSDFKENVPILAGASGPDPICAEWPMKKCTNNVYFDDDL